MASGKTIKQTAHPQGQLGKLTLKAFAKTAKPAKKAKHSPVVAKAAMVLPEGYRKLVFQFALRPLQSDADLDRAIAVVDSLLDRDDLDAGERDYLDVLSDLVERYEDQTNPPRDVSDAEMLRFLMEQSSVKQVELSRATGIVESTISAVLSGKRTLNRAQIGKLASHFHVSPGVFAFND
ncbi:MAG: helix-turn-helix domain-containing protein [Planctomycetia bacterium]|nr:helix-turn-helix domain-containing protein [Planctomycetia bacterium]